jgi:hypothetical protein
MVFKRPVMVLWSITFIPSEVIHEGCSYPTELVTRFDYGSRQALTGQAPLQNKYGPMADPFLVRMCIEDAEAVELSVNNWQTHVNHKIRDTLDRALTAVRQEKAQAERVATYGIRPPSAVCATTDAAQGGKSLCSRPFEVILTSGRSPFWDCRIKGRNW